MEVIAVASLQKCRLQNSRESGAEISAAVALAAAAPVLAVLFTIVIDVVALVVIVVVVYAQRDFLPCASVVHFEPTTATTNGTFVFNTHIHFTFKSSTFVYIFNSNIF